MKKHAPATARNSAAIAEVLKNELPESGTVLEIASGSGEHALYFAGKFPALTWQPSDLVTGSLESIAAWTGESGCTNIASPIELDAASRNWPITQADAIFCCNMIHISSWSATEGLFAGAGRLLKSGSPLIVYGPFIEDGVSTASSNLSFDRNLKERNPDWGLRSLEDIDMLAERFGLIRKSRWQMPANNLSLVFQPQ